MANWEKLIEERYIKKKQVKVSTLLEMIDLELEDAFQSGAIQGHAGKRLSTKGGRKLGGDPFDQDPPRERSKSAPAGFGVLEEQGEEDVFITRAAKPEVLKTVLELLRNNGYPYASIKGVSKKTGKKFPAGTASINNLGTKAQRQAIHDLLRSTLGEEEEGQFSGVTYKHVVYRGQEIVLLAGEQSATADGVPVEKSPNRGDVSEAFIALATLLRLLHLPEVATTGEDGEVVPARGLVTVEQVKDFFINGYKGVKPSLDNQGNLVAQGQVTSPKGSIDTLEMEVGLRSYSMKGFDEIR